MDLHQNSVVPMQHCAHDQCVLLWLRRKPSSFLIDITFLLLLCCVVPETFCSFLEIYVMMSSLPPEHLHSAVTILFSDCPSKSVQDSNHMRMNVVVVFGPQSCVETVHL